MNNNNKILTVSYGTFSCTLEGFDDSFDTMKAIAEYFRDLAADDRYFGAEPPQPDADMLARIAQREVSRRVEAHEHEGRIMLKAHEETGFAPEAKAVAAPVAVADVQADATQTEDVQVEETDATAPKDKSPATALVSDSVVSDSDVSDTEQAHNDIAGIQPDTASHGIVDPELSEPMMADAEEKIEDTAVDVTAIAEMPVDDVVIEDAVEETSGVSAEPQISDDESTFIDDDETHETEAETNDVAETRPDDLEDVAAFFAESAAAAQPDMSSEEEIPPYSSAAPASPVEGISDEFEALDAEVVEAASGSFDGESLADKLQRIRAVVSERADDALETEYSEDIEEPAPVQGFAEFTNLNSESAAEEATIEHATDAPQNEIVAEAAQDIADAFEADDALVDAQSTTESFDKDDDLDALLRRIEAQEDELEDEQPVDLSAEVEDDEPAENLFAEVEDEVELADTDIHGRVLKVNRTDLEAALEAGDLEEYAEADDALGTAFNDEDALVLQDDFSVLEDDAEGKLATEQSAARESLPDIDTDAGEDVSRLMAEADQQMQEPEGKTRRSAFAHLRAAVAARFADRSMDEPDKTIEEAAEAYRNDLAEVVKPRRPIATSRSERPSDARPAPLKLVAEQRIDPEMSQPRGPVSPRRVAAADEYDPETPEDSGFADYAQEHGAETLPEILEAAAAYLAFVEGHDQFSRPQLMSRVRQADCGDFSREDGLRSFGQLLRTGKIEKIKGGRFAASEAIGFKPDHRAVG